MTNISPEELGNYLVVAVRFSNLEKAKELIAQGASLKETYTITDEYGGSEELSLIYLAFENNDAEMLTLLVANGLKLERKPNDLLVHIVVNYPNELAMIKFLLKNGANINHRNFNYYGGYNGYSILDVILAKSNSLKYYKETIDYLLSEGATRSIDDEEPKKAQTPDALRRD